MPSPAELKTVGDDSCSTLEEEEENNMVTTITEQKKVILIQNVKVPIQSRNLHLRSSILMIMPEMGNLH
jgi:hypothetical protein